LNPNEFSSSASQLAKLSKNKLSSKADKIVQQAGKKIDKLQDLPNDLHLLITFYLAPIELIFNLQMLSRYWRKYTKDPKIWELLNKVKPLEVGERL
jgi:F-box domain